jgi:hypothetical protein
MYPSPPRNLLSFLGAEHENELVSTHKHARDLDMLSHIDGLFQAPVPHLDVPKGQHAVAQLYLFIHYHLYSTVANLMRLHVAEALGCERKAIDAALTAYELLTDPASALAYEAREWRFLTIKAFIEKARKRDPTAYPLADELIKAWDMCSEFGAHADSNTFALRLDQVPVENNPNQQKLSFLYFQAPATTDEAHLYYVDAFATFLAMTRVFEPFIKNCAKGFPFEDWGTRRDQIDAVVRKELARLHRAMAEPSEDAEGSDL